MPLQPRDAVHEEQIKAGTTGRLKGHDFEKHLTQCLNSFNYTDDLLRQYADHLVTGHPAIELVRYICQTEKIGKINEIKATWLGGIATFKEGYTPRDRSESLARKSKSDVVVQINYADGKVIRRGVSVKTCDKKTPTNDQLFLSTARAFCDLLRSNGIEFSKQAENGLRMFCGDMGFRPIDRYAREELRERKSDPERFFWEELPKDGREELEKIFTDNQKSITTILLQRAYPGDPCPPDYLLHQRFKYSDINQCPLAIFKIEELVNFSCQFGSFSKREYTIRKGRYKNDPNIHEAPRFGFIQFQRFGNVQNATQLQFNLKAGYFDTIPDLEKKHL